MYWRSIRSRSGQWLFRGHSFSEPPTETVGRRPCSHGGGPLRELDGQCPPSPIAGSPVPCSAPSGALRRNTKGMRAPIGPLRSGFRPPPLAPAKGGRWLRTASAPGLRLPPAASPADSAGSRLCPLGSGYRRLCPPVAPPPSRPPARLATPCGRLGRLRHSVLRLALGLLRVGLRPALRAAAGSPPALLRPVAVGPPRTAPPAPCPPSSLGRLVAWVGCGLRSSRLGPGAALRAASLRPRPQAFFENTVGGQNWFVKLAVFRSFQRRTAARNGNTVQGRIRRESGDHSGSSPNTLREKKRKEYTSEVENSEKVPDFTCVHCITFFSGSALITTIML